MSRWRRGRRSRRLSAGILGRGCRNPGRDVQGSLRRTAFVAAPCAYCSASASGNEDREPPPADHHDQRDVGENTRRRDLSRWRGRVRGHRQRRTPSTRPLPTIHARTGTLGRNSEQRKVDQVLCTRKIAPPTSHRVHEEAATGRGARRKSGLSIDVSGRRSAPPNANSSTHNTRFEPPRTQHVIRIRRENRIAAITIDPRAGPTDAPATGM
jgi:hypothetical protein